MQKAAIIMEVTRLILVFVVLAGKGMVNSPHARQALALAQTELLRERAEAEERRDRFRDGLLGGASRSAFRSFFRF